MSLAKVIEAADLKAASAGLVAGLALALAALGVPRAFLPVVDALWPAEGPFYTFRFAKLLLTNGALWRLP